MNDPVVAVALELIHQMVQGEPCWLDHDGECHEHGWYPDEYSRECPHPRARRLLEEQNFRPGVPMPTPAATAHDATAVYVHPKMLREALCAAQSSLDAQARRGVDADRVSPWVEHIGAVISAVDRHRPLGPDGGHGDRHTPSCGCEDRKVGWSITFATPEMSTKDRDRE